MGDNTGRNYFVGVDLGGTKILAGLFDAKLQPLGATKLSTKAQRGSDAVLERVARCVLDAIDECDLETKQIRGVGIGAPGVVDQEHGEVIFAPNLGWKDVAAVKELEKRLDLPVFLENDCHVCMLGVYEQELKSKPKHVVGIFIGTGIGGGIIINGELFTGANHTAGELGHMVIDINGPKCSCGNKGCFEVLASRLALFRAIQAAVKNGQKSELTEMLGEDLKDLRSGDIRKAIRRGDKVVEKIVEEAAEYTGIAVANLVNLLNPEIVVLGGGVIEALGDEMMPTITKSAKSHVMPGLFKNVEIIASKLGDNAGITGAAVLARNKTR
ncbi:MAG TPA: ROK family protein [Methylomirabilota bacterium]|nr:ROK family protein [Methylomirabilota bacterium]